jgi:cephalosporin hydroxylase
MRKWKTILQNDAEFAWFTDILQRENVRSYLEIGSKFGGSLWRVAMSLPVGSRTVSVDLPQGDRSFKETRPHLEACVAELNARGYQASLIIGDSTDPQIVERAKALGPYDALFVDGSHTLKGATADWQNYGPLARIVAFHDIGWQPRPAPSKKDPIEVPLLWNSIKVNYRHEEIRLDQRDNGIGVLWRS